MVGTPKYPDVNEMTIEELVKELNNGVTNHRGRTIKPILRSAGYDIDRADNTWKYIGEGEPPLNELGSKYTTPEGTIKNTKVQSSTPLKQNVKTSTPTHSDFTGYEIDVLKGIVEERKRNIELFTEYRVYEELSKVPVGVDQVRSAFNMSKETTERLKKYASVRRIPLQDIVELAVIKLLDQYDK